jgi:hypothetical protein
MFALNGEGGGGGVDAMQLALAQVVAKIQRHDASSRVGHEHPCVVE